MQGEIKKINRYLNRLPPDLLNLKTIDSIEILEMTPGSYNLNFHVKVNQTAFNFRINIDQQSGLCNQIEYEFRILKFLEGKRIAPKAFLFDDSCRHFEFGIMIQEYLQGPHLSFMSENILQAAELLVRLHSIKSLGSQPFVIWPDPLVDTYRLVQDDVTLYESKKDRDEKTLSLAKKTLQRIEPMIHQYRQLYHSDSLNHTDVGLDNFIQSPRGLRLIDWEKPRIDDGTYDLCCFLSEPAELWCSEKILNRKERRAFIDEYARLSGKRKDRLIIKVQVREPLVSLHWILWGATKLCDLKNRSTSPKLLEAHEEKTVRYQRISGSHHIEKILDILI